MCRKVYFCVLLFFFVNLSGFADDQFITIPKSAIQQIISYDIYPGLENSMRDPEGRKEQKRKDFTRTPFLTRLHLAILLNQPLQVKALLTQNLRKSQDKGSSPLQKQVLLARQKAFVNTRDRTEEGYTPLQLAAMVGNEKIVQMLLENGANPNQVTRDGSMETPLHLAWRFPKIIQALVNAGADLESKDEEGSTVLHRASSNGSLETVQFLILEKKMDPNVPNDSDHSPLYEAVVNNRVEVVKFLLRYGVETEVKLTGPHNQAFFHTSLLHAALEGSRQKNCNGLLETLLKWKLGDIETKSKGLTLLHLAARYNNAEAAEFLILQGAKLENDADPDARLFPSKPLPFLRMTALHIAAYYGSSDVIRVLLKHGANQSAKTVAGINDIIRTPLILTTFNRPNIEAIEQLMSDPQKDFLHLNSGLQNGAEQVRFRLAFGWPVTLQKLVQEQELISRVLDSFDRAILKEQNHLTAEEKNALLVILEKKGDPRNRAFELNSALIYAAGQGKVNQVAFLLQKGALPFKALRFLKIAQQNPYSPYRAVYPEVEKLLLEKKLELESGLIQKGTYLNLLSTDFLAKIAGYWGDLDAQKNPVKHFQTIAAAVARKEAVQRDDVTALMFKAIENGDVNALEDSLRNRADPNAEYEGQNVLWKVFHLPDPMTAAQLLKVLVHPEYGMALNPHKIFLDDHLDCFKPLFSKDNLKCSYNRTLSFFAALALEKGSWLAPRMGLIRDFVELARERGEINPRELRNLTRSLEEASQ